MSVALALAWTPATPGALAVAADASVGAVFPSIDEIRSGAGAVDDAGALAEPEAATAGAFHWPELERGLGPLRLRGAAGEAEAGEGPKRERAGDPSTHGDSLRLRAASSRRVASPATGPRGPLLLLSLRSAADGGRCGVFGRPGDPGGSGPESSPDSQQPANSPRSIIRGSMTAPRLPRTRSTTMALSAAAERFLSGPLLAEVDADARLALSRALVEDRAPDGARLIEQGRPNDRLWFLVEGAVAIARRIGGEDQVLARFEAPGIFGATSFFRPNNPPTASIRAASGVAYLTLDHAGHDRLRRDEPRAAEALALAAVRALAERFDLLDVRFTEYLASHADDQPRGNEWSAFRARLFEEPNII